MPRGDRQRVGRLPAQCDAGGEAFLAVDVALRHLLREPVEPVDIAAVAAIPDAGAQPDLVLLDRRAAGEPDLVAGCAVLRYRHLAPAIEADRVIVWRRRDEAHCATDRTTAEQRALRPAQHLDPVEVEHLRIGVAERRADPCPRLDRGVVDIDAGGRDARAGIHAADRDRRLAGAEGGGALAEGDAGRQPGDVAD